MLAMMAIVAFVAAGGGDGVGGSTGVKVITAALDGHHKRVSGGCSRLSCSRVTATLSMSRRAVSLHPGGWFVRLRGRCRRVRRPAPASSCVLEALQQVAGLEHRLVVLTRGDEEQPPKNEQQLCGCKQTRNRRTREWMVDEDGRGKPPRAGWTDHSRQRRAMRGPTGSAAPHKNEGETTPATTKRRVHTLTKLEHLPPPVRGSSALTLGSHHSLMGRSGLLEGIMSNKEPELNLLGTCSFSTHPRIPRCCLGSCRGLMG